MVVYVRNGNVQQALKVLKRKLQKNSREREIARKASFLKPAEQRRADHRRSLKRIRKEQNDG